MWRCDALKGWKSRRDMYRGLSNLRMASQPSRLIAIQGFNNQASAALDNLRYISEETLMPKRLWIALCVFVSLTSFAQSPRESASINVDYNLGTMEIRQAPNAAARVNRSIRYPEILLPVVWDRRETLRYLGESQYEGQKQWVITFAHQNGAQISLYFNAQTGLLTKSEILSDHPVLGDTADEIVYGDWRPVGRLTLPFRHINKVGGVILQDLRASSITVDAKLDESLFVAPEGLAKVERTPPARKIVSKREFDDGAHRVELYEFSNPHCAEMIIAWLPKEKILFEADMLDITYTDHIGQGGEDTAALLEKIQELGLEAERIVPVHGQLGTIDHLRRAVERNKANK